MTGLAIALETSAFSLRSIDVTGASPRVSAEVRAALAPLLDRNLVSLDGGDAQRRLLALPDIADARVDRAFPHTLRVAVRVERPATVLRQADRAWLAAADARVLRELRARPYPKLPRVWLPRTADVVAGATLGGDAGAAARVAALLPGSGLPVRVRSVASANGLVTVRLQSGEEVRLGRAEQLRLKLAVAVRLVRLAPDARYVDVSVPTRAVVSEKPQVAG